MQLEDVMELPLARLAILSFLCLDAFLLGETCSVMLFHEQHPDGVVGDGLGDN